MTKRMSGNTITDLLGSIYKQYLEFTSESTLMVDAFLTDDEHSIYINRVNKELFCLELSGDSNIAKLISMETLNNIYENYQFDDTQLLITFLNKDFFQKVYLFSSSKELLLLIKSNVSGVLLKNYQVLDAVYNLFMDCEFSIKNKVIQSDFDVAKEIDYENISNSFNKIVKDAVYKNIVDYDIFQVTEFRTRVNPYVQENLFRLDWQGAIFINVSFNRDDVNAVLAQRIFQARFEKGDNPYKDLKKAYNNGETQLINLNGILMLKTRDVSEINNTVTLISNALSINLKRKARYKDALMKYTLLKKRDVEWDMVQNLEWLNGFIQNNHKLSFDDERLAMFCARDLNKAHVNINFAETTPFKTNTSTDFLVVGVKGSGKTTSLNAMMAQIIGIDIVKKQFEPVNIYNGFVEARIFDIKNSSRPLYELIKDQRGVGFLDTALENYKYNPLNIPYTIVNGKVILNENILEMNILLLSITLEVKNRGDASVGFDNQMQTIMRDIIKDLYKNLEDGTLNTVSIHSLEKTHPKEYQELIALGYDGIERIGSVKEKGYEHLKAPTLDMVINKVSLLKQSDVDKNRQRSAENLYSKLKDIHSMGIFSGLDKINISEVLYLYMNFDPIKDLPEFVPIFLSMATTLFLFDKAKQRERLDKGIERPYIIYLWEEAVNLFLQPSFESFLIKFNNEARSDRIVAGYVAQVIEQVPKYIFDQVENKLILFPSEGNKDNIIKAITKVAEPKQEIIDMFKKTSQFEICLWNEHGATILNMNLSEEERSIFGQAK